MPRLKCFTTFAGWALAGCTLLGGAVAHAQTSPLGAPVSSWVPNGSVSGLALDGHVLYVGGEFDQVGPPSGTFAVVDVTAGSAFTTGANLPPAVNATVSDGAGGWFVATANVRSFSDVTLNVDHVLPGGARDPAWTRPSFDQGGGVVLAFAAGRLFVGGGFTTVNGVPRGGLVALEPTSGAVLPWRSDIAQLDPPTFAGVVTGIATSSGRLYVGGAFDHAGGVARKNFAVLDAATGAVLAPTLQVQYIGGTSIAGNRVYVSGTCQASSLPAICAYDLDLIPLPGWTFPFANQFIGPIAAADSALFATHRSFDFPFVERTVKLDPATGAEVSWTAVVTTGGTDVLTVAAGRLYLGGRFTAVNGQARTRLAALDATTGALDAWAPLVGGPVAALSVQGGEVAFGGSFTSAGGIKKRNLVAIDLRTGQPTSPNAPDLPITATAYLKLGDVMVVAGGRLPAITPTEPDVMAFLTSTGALLPWSLTSDWQVAALATDGRRLYLGGRFSQISGVARRNVAAVDLQTAALDAWNPSSTDPVRTLAVSEGALYAGGGYPGSPGGGPDPHNMVAAWDLASGSVLPFSPRAAMLTTAGLAFHRQRVLLVGGPVDALEWVDRSSGAPVPPASAIGGIGYAAAQAGDTVFVTGSSAVGTGAVALVDAPSGRIQVWEPGGSPGAIAANTDYVALGGFFAGDSGGRIPGTLLVYRTPTSGAPQHVTATVENATVTLGWQPGTAPAATSFLVEVGTSSGAIDIGSFAVGPATSVSGTLPAGTYFTRIRGVGANGPGTASSEVIVTVPATSTPPNAPGTLSVSVASGVVTLQWGAASGNATTYVVEAGSASGLSTIGTFATGHLDTSVTTPAPSGTYFVRIRAANAFGTSTPSNEVTVVVP